ncbi:hypothetical protein F25303_13750, partial [Fusarium sp. NRRL 25303]
NKVDEGIDLGTRILNLLPSVHTRALDRDDQQFVVSTFAGVASNLCSFLLSANRLSEALECLEQGRAIIISQMLDDRSDLSSLCQDHSHLANRYQSLVDEVNVPIRETTPDVVESLLRKRRQEAAAELDMCLKEIRCVPGHERFMLGKTIAEMQECITEGSIVVTNITDFRSDAIIVSSNSLRTIALPDLSASKARSWALGYAQNQAKRAQEALVAQDANKMLIAAMPTSPKGPGDKKAPKKLPGVEEEMREILILAHSQTSPTVLTHPSADQVLEVLKACRIAHFACHGTSDSSDPSNSGLILQKSTGPDESLMQDRLTVQQVSDLRLRYAQIAYLSACSTAENKAARLSDEVIHVVSGFQVAGFPHVVGCLWPAGDSECVEVSKRFYSLVLKCNQSVINNEVASALQEAVMAVRAEDLSMPLNWAQFVHYGV